MTMVSGVPPKADSGVSQGSGFKGSPFEVVLTLNL